MLYQLHRYIFKAQLFKGVGGGKEKKPKPNNNLCMQLLCKLPLRALEFTDIGGHRKAPVHQHSLTWLEALLALGHHRADAFSLPEIRYTHLTQPDELHNRPNVNKKRLNHSKEKLPCDFRFLSDLSLNRSSITFQRTICKRKITILPTCPS